MRRPSLVPILVSAIAIGCQGDTSPAGPETPTPSPPDIAASISDGAHGGDPHFYFLPPLVPDPSPTGTFEPEFLPYLRVEICEWDGTACAGEPVAVFTADGHPASHAIRVDEKDEHYIVNWQPRGDDLDPDLTYRLRVLARKAVFGWIDLTGSDLASSSIPIRFAIEKGVRGAIVLDSDGGTVLSDDETLRIDIPPNAIPSESTILWIERGGEAGPAVLGASFVGPSFNVNADGTTFSLPLQFTWSLANLAESSALDVNALAVYHWDTDAQLAAVIPSEASTNALHFEIYHLSTFRLGTGCQPASWCVYTLKWQLRHLKWYIEPPGGASFLNDPTLVRDAFDRWTVASQNQVTFEEVHTPTDAHIILSEGTPACPENEWAPEPDIWILGRPLQGAFGIACFPLDVWENRRFRLVATDQIRVRLNSALIARCDDFIRFGTCGSGGEIEFGRRVIAHEIGHALGIAHTAVQVRDPTQRPIMQRGLAQGSQFHVWDEEAVQALYPVVTVPPTIDGVLGPGEWTGAEVAQFDIVGFTGAVEQATLYLRSDATNVYIALSYTPSQALLEDSQAAFVWFVFDNDGGGVTWFDLEIGDDFIQLNGLSGAAPESDMHTCRISSLAWCRDVVTGGTEDGQFAMNMGVFEVSHPLDSSDDLHDFSLREGDVVGLGILHAFVSATRDPGSGGFPHVESYWPGPGRLARIQIGGP